MSLKQQFPDLNQSVMDDVLKMCRGDKKKAQQVFNDMEATHKKDLEKARQRKVEELQRIFSTLSKELIVQVLEENKWDEDKAVVPLFEKVEEMRANEKKQRNDEYKRNFVAQARQRGSMAIKNIYDKIPEEELGKIFEEYDDFDAAVDCITKRLVEEDKKTQANDMKVETLRTQFSPEISEQEIVSTLQQYNWNLKIATAELLKVSEDKRVKSIHLLHPNLSENYIRRVLEANDWQVSKTVKLLSNLHKEEEPQKPVDPNAFPLRSQLLGDELEKVLQQRQQAETQEQMKLIKAELEAKLRGADLPGHISENDSEPGSLFPFILRASPARVDIGGQITVEWKTVDHEVTPSDWVGIYYSDSTNKRYITYQYIGKTDSKNGTLTFSVPKQHGSSNFRYFSNKSYSIKGISNVVKVGPEFSVVPTREEGHDTKISVQVLKLSGNEYPNAWVGVYDGAEKPNGKYLASEWLSKAVGNKLTFDVPKTGDWELRLFLDRAFISSYVDYLRTSVNLQGEDNLTLGYADNKITVKSKVVTIDPYYDSAWIGLYFVTEINNRQWRRYRYVKSRYAEFVIAAPRTKGNYEARLFAYKAYDKVLCKSNSIVI